jgi:hypothetical protein
MTEILFVAAIIVVLVIVFVVLSRRSSAAPSDDAARDSEMEEGVVSEPVPVAATAPRATIVKAEGEVATATASGTAPRWAKQFEPRSRILDDASRLRLINDLGMLRAAWCIPLLERAWEEETDPTNKIAARQALARCHGEAMSPLYLSRPN